MLGWLKKPFASQDSNTEKSGLVKGVHQYPTTQTGTYGTTSNSAPVKPDSSSLRNRKGYKAVI